MMTRPSLRDFVTTREEFDSRMGEVFSWIHKKMLSIRIGAEVPLKEAVKAHLLLESRKTIGKLLLIP